MSTFPSVVASLTDPLPTQRLNAPSHSSIHSAANGEIIQVETFIGTLPSSAVGTLLYDIRSPDSNGGGHVQTATTGGTGQTFYTKGDLLVGQSSSVLSKLAISSVTGQVLTVDPTQISGVKWGPAVANTKIALTTASVVISGGAGSVATVLYAASILGSTLGTNNALKYKGYYNNLTFPQNQSFTIQANYGNQNLGTATVQRSTTSILTSSGYVEGYILAAGSISSQFGYVSLGGNFSDNISNGLGGFISTGVSNMSSVLSDAPQNLVITAQFSNGDPTNSVLSHSLIVEKIS